MERYSNDNGYAIRATQSYGVNDIVHELKGEYVDSPTRTSIEVGSGKHIEDKLGIYINHSFTPTCKIDNGCVVSLTNIKIDQEITFNYNDSETRMATPFIDKGTNNMVSGKILNTFACNHIKIFT